MTPLPAEWGVHPVLFTVAGHPVRAYPVFMLLAVAVGLLIFAYEARRAGRAGEKTFMVLVGALLGGVLGSKIPMILLYGREMAAQWPDVTLLVTSRSIVGGLAGGALGVWAVKRGLGITGRRGNLFVPAIAAGVAIGRLGCFFQGCCYGTPTTLPWAVDFGDGTGRHPTQLYELAFMLVLLAAGWRAVRRFPEPAGAVFKLFMLTYFAFRFAIEFVREEPKAGLGLSLFQWMAVGLVLFYAVDWLRLRRKVESGKVMSREGTI